MPEDVHDFDIHKLYGDKEEQGRKVATIRCNSYKWGPMNAARAFVRLIKPPPGRYLVHGPATDGDLVQGSNIFSVSYPEAVIECGGHTTICGDLPHTWGGYGWRPTPEIVWKDDKWLQL